MTDNDLLQAGDLKIVGSVLSKKHPRDIDVILVIPDDIFKSLFLPPQQWADEGRTGNWSDKRFFWSRRCVDLGKELSKRLGFFLALDFRILPKSFEDYGKTKIEDLSVQGLA